jgi:shikimate kinase
MPVSIVVLKRFSDFIRWFLLLNAYQKIPTFVSRTTFSQILIMENSTDLNSLRGLSVFLLGMMGCGKSTVGELLSRRLQYRFFDTDVLVERVAGKKITAIFADEGEATFRELETQVLEELSSLTKTVIATGGGIVLKPMNWSYLRHGLMIWLDAPVDILVKRLKKDTSRPLLKSTDLKSKLELLLEQRRALYAEADIHIIISDLDTPAQIVEKILTAIPTVIKQRHPESDNN